VAASFTGPFGPAAIAWRGAASPGAVPRFGVELFADKPLRLLGRASLVQHVQRLAEHALFAFGALKAARQAFARRRVMRAGASLRRRTLPGRRRRLFRLLARRDRRDAHRKREAEDDRLHSMSSPRSSASRLNRSIPMLTASRSLRSDEISSAMPKSHDPPAMRNASSSAAIRSLTSVVATAVGV